MFFKDLNNLENLGSSTFNAKTFGSDMQQNNIFISQQNQSNVANYFASADQTNSKSSFDLVNFQNNFFDHNEHTYSAKNSNKKHVIDNWM